MKEILKLKRLYLLALLPLSGILVLIARLSSSYVEKFHIPFIYKPLSFIIGSIVSLIPFSVFELFVALSVGFCIYYIIKNRKKPLKMLINFLCVLSVGVFLFEMTMGLNYYRYEAKHYLGLEVKKSSKQELYELCKILANDLNENRKEAKIEGGVVVLSDKNRVATSNDARKAYQKLSEKYPVLKGANIRNKPLLSSKLFSHFMTTGIYIPILCESNINTDVPQHTIPATMCHELTHFRGFMRENEANFLGYLACMSSDRADFRYSGTLMAFGYAYPKLYDEDAKLAAEISKMLDPGIINDIRIEDEYWQKYQDKVASEVSDKVYDSYLNANGQTSGIKSYGEMVDLLIAYYNN